MVRKEKLAEEEHALKEKYALLRKQRQQQQQPQQQQSSETSDTQEVKKPPQPEVTVSPSLIDKAKLELAKKALAQSLQKDTAQKERGFKRPAASRIKEETTTEQTKKQKINEQPEVQRHPPLSIRDKRDRRNMVPPNEEVEGDYYPTTIFVGDLPEGISEIELQKHFSPFGEIDCIRLISPKNFAFIKYTSREGADKAISSMNASTISSIPIRVSKARIHTAQHTWRKSWDGWSIQDKHNVTSQSFEAPVLPPTVYTPPPLPQLAGTDGKVAFETPRGSEYSDLVRDRTVLRYDDL